MLPASRVRPAARRRGPRVGSRRSAHTVPDYPRRLTPTARDGRVADTDAFLLTYGDRGRPDGSPDARLVLMKPLDREPQPRTGSVEVDVDIRWSPIFDQDYESSLPENVQAQTTFVRVHAIDDDVGLTTGSSTRCRRSRSPHTAACSPSRTRPTCSSRDGSTTRTVQFNG